jgi:hypothetical protein
MIVTRRKIKEKKIKERIERRMEANKVRIKALFQKLEGKSE